MPIALEPFDPSRDFVAQNFFRAGGKIWTRKEPFDKSYVNERVLRQLYEARQIAYPPATEAAEADSAPEGSSTTEIAVSPASEPPAAAEGPSDTEEASGTAREAPGASESSDATSGEASASEPTGEEAVPEDAPPSESTETTADAVTEAAPAADEAAAAPAGEAATAAAEAEMPQLDHDHDGNAGGSEPDNTGSPEELIKRLVGRHTHAQLLEQAKDLKGVTKSQTKAELAAVLVKAGRVGDGAA